jgi:hypothetical protein
VDNWDILNTGYLLDTPWVQVIYDRLRHRVRGDERDYYYLSMDIGTHLFLARGLTWVGQRLDPGEELEVVAMPFDQALELVLSGELLDGSLMLGVLLVAGRGLAP